MVARSSRRVITVTTGSGGACPARDRGPAPAAGLPGPSAGRSRAATSSQSSPPRTLTGRTSSTQLIRPLAVSSWQSSCRPLSVRAAAASSERTAGRPGRFDERTERLPGRVAAGRPEQRARGRVGAAHGAVLAEHEQGGGHLLEHRVQQAALGVHGARRPLILARRGRLGLSRAQRVDRAVQLGQGRVEQRPQVRAGHRGGLLQGLVAGTQLRHAVARRLAVRDVWHGANPI